MVPTMTTAATAPVMIMRLTFFFWAAAAAASAGDSCAGGGGILGPARLAASLVAPPAAALAAARAAWVGGGGMPGGGRGSQLQTVDLKLWKDGRVGMSSQSQYWRHRMAQSSVCLVRGCLLLMPSEGSRRGTDGMEVVSLNCPFSVTVPQPLVRRPVSLPGLVPLCQFLPSKLPLLSSSFSSSSSTPESQWCGEKVNVNLGRRWRGA